MADLPRCTWCRNRRPLITITIAGSDRDICSKCAKVLEIPENAIGASIDPKTGKVVAHYGSQVQ